MDRIKVGIIGATGMVGQRFISMLANHPYFEVTSLMASVKSTGKKYSDAAKWYLNQDIPKRFGDMQIREIDAEGAKKEGVEIIFSAIPSDIAMEVEGSFAKHLPVFSNTATYRMENDVPLIVPEINPEHTNLVPLQKKKRGWKGFIVTNPNCTTIGFVIPLKPIYDKFGIEYVHMTSMQALSGAGYDGVPSMAITDNLLPYIRGEEEKVETEGLKILGAFKDGRIDNADFNVFASCNRVSVLDGHTICAFVKIRKDAELAEIKDALKCFKGEPQKLNLPTAPINPVYVLDEEDRPQPRKDRDRDKGMAVTVGRLRKQKGLVKFTCVSHNTIRGAAGASILNAELMVEKGQI